MTEHRGTAFYNSCVKVPVDPCSRQPTPSYERPLLRKTEKYDYTDSSRKINFAKGNEHISDSESSSPRETLDNFLEFLESIPDYRQVHHLSNEQFKRKLDYLKRKQRLFLKNMENSLADNNPESSSRISIPKNDQHSKNKDEMDISKLRLSGKKCCLEESRSSSPILFPSGTFSGLTEDQDLLTYRCKSKDKETKTLRNEEILANENWYKTNDLKSSESMDESDTDSIETKSLPPSSSKEWHPTVPQPFSFTLREDAEKYMTLAEKEADECTNFDSGKKTSSKKGRRVRRIPLTSKIPLYDKLLAEKEERSRLVREKSALNLMSQVRPFRLECDRRAWRSLARSSPELRSKSGCSSSRFKAKPVPKNLFGTEIYDRMLEDEYYRQLQKKIRAAELMKSSSLPPSMARRERVKSAFGGSENGTSNYNAFDESRDSPPLSNAASTPLERSKSVSSLLPSRGNNLAAILRCQASREKLEREIRERMEEKRREQDAKMKEFLTGRKPVWRALRSAARHEHERDLDIRTSLRRYEAREQAERHRLQMEMMIDRVTQIPTLFERHSQNCQLLTKAKQKHIGKGSHRKKKKLKRQNSNSVDSCGSCATNSRPNSGSLSSSSGTLASLGRSSKSSGTKSSGSRLSGKSVAKSENSSMKKKDRGQLKVSIKETAELIDDRGSNQLFGSERSSSVGREGNILQSDDHDTS